MPLDNQEEENPHKNSSRRIRAKKLKPNYVKPKPIPRLPKISQDSLTESNPSEESERLDIRHEYHDFTISEEDHDISKDISKIFEESKHPSNEESKQEINQLEAQPQRFNRMKKLSTGFKKLLRDFEYSDSNRKSALHEEERQISSALPIIRKLNLN